MKWAEYYDESMIRQTINYLKPNHELFEVRIIGKGNRKRIISGYFTDVDTLIKQFDTIDHRGTNMYITINKINDDLYARAQHDCFRMTDEDTHDYEVDAYEWLFVDLDPKRISGISSTDSELEAAHVLSDKVYNYMKGLGFNEPVRGMSGNGYHLLYRISLPNTDDNKNLVGRCLENLSAMFDTDKVKIDVINHNQSRVCKLYGTLAQKGSNTKVRPHRMSKLTSIPKKIEVNEIDLLNVLANELPEPPKPAKKNTASSTSTEFNIEDWMQEHGLEPIRSDAGTDCTIYPLANCPFDHSHTNGDSKIFKYSNGAIAFKCHHNSCRGKVWQDVRELLEPGAYDNNDADSERIDEGYRQHKQYLMIQKTDNVEAVKKGLPKLTAISAYDLQNKEFEERYYAVDGMIPEGETVIAAPPKTGKSWLMLDMCLKVAEGKSFLGFETKQSDTLYLALEDGDSFEQERLNIVTDGSEAPKNFHFVFSNVMPMNEGFLLQLEELLKLFPDIKVVVIDTLQFVKYRQGKSESAYECDYRTGRDLKEFAEKNHLAVVVVTHTTKMIHIEDEMSNVSGTNGVTGAADAVVVLSKEKRTDKEAKMFITGRKVRQSMHNIKFDDSRCQWEYVGVAETGDKDQREKEEKERLYYNSKIREAVIKIAENLGDEPFWRGRAGELIESAVLFGIGLRETNKEIGGFINKMQGMFFDADGVLIEKIKNGTGPWIYKIYPKKEEDCPFL
jgi:hypothetical protein